MVSLRFMRISMTLLLCVSYVRDVRCMYHNFSEIGRLMYDYCPYNVICRTGEPKLVSKISGQAGCCTDCSCEETCGLTESCCFPSLDKYRIVDRSHQKCIITTSSFAGFDQVTGFNMIVDEFPNGNGSNCGDNITKCGENENATSIGSLYPVFAKKTGRIYKNMACAKCHGLNEKDIIEWQVWLTCDEFNSLFPIDIMTSLNGFETGKLSQFCGYQFIYPGPIEDIKTEKCVVNPTDSCREDYDAFESLSREEIRTYCLNGVYSPYLVQYKNIFCYLCSAYNMGIDKKMTCRSDYISDRIGMVSFAALIASSVLENKKQKQQIQQAYRFACPREADLNESNSDSCREVYCPAGQILQTDGECIYPSKQWDRVILTLTIKLLPQFEDMKEEDILNNKDTDFSTMLTNKTLSPWFSGWELKLFAYTTKITNGNQRVIDHFLVKLELKRYDTNIAAFLKHIQINLRKVWYLHLNKSLYPNKQKLSEFTDFYRVLNRTGNTSLYTHVQFPSTTLDLPDFPIYIELTYMNIMPSIYITKMFFCEQIQLRPDEYELDIYSKVLYYIKQKRFFSIGEFTALHDEVNAFYIRICLEDSLFHLQHVSNSESISSKYLRRVLLLYFVTLQIIALRVREG